MTMYDVYVTNDQTENAYVRLKAQELSSVNPKFHQELHSLVRQGEMDKSYIQTFLVRWGFRLIPPRETVSFATVACSSSGGTLCTLLCMPGQNYGLWMKKSISTNLDACLSEVIIRRQP